LPAGVVRAVAKGLGRSDAAQRLFSPLQVDIGRIRRELGWLPPVSVDAGLRATVRWFLDTRGKGAV
jgi:UDP-glucose 4-epimerase